MRREGTWIGRRLRRGINAGGAGRWRRARPARAGGGGRGRRGPAEEGRSGAGGREGGWERQCDFAQGRLCCTDMQEGEWLAPKGEGGAVLGEEREWGPWGSNEPWRRGESSEEGVVVPLYLSMYKSLRGGGGEL